MESKHFAFGFVVILALAALAIVFVLDGRFQGGGSGPSAYDVPPGTVPRQPEPNAPSP